MTHELRDYNGGAVATTITSVITAGSTAISIAATTNWPLGGANGPFFAVLDRGTASEERIKVTSRSGSTLTVGTRGADGTTATAHALGATIEHCFSATDADEANSHYADTTLDHHTQYLTNARGDVRYPLKSVATTKGDLWVATGAGVLVRLGVGTDGQVLAADSAQSTGLRYVTPAQTLVPTQTYIATNESTTSTSFTDLATPGPAVTVTVGSSGRVMVMLRADNYNATPATPTFMSYAVSGASTAAASDDFALRSNGDEFAASLVTIETGFTPGSTTFTAKYRVVGGTGQWLRRSLIVIPL